MNIDIKKILIILIGILLIVLNVVPFITMQKFINFHVKYNEIYRAEDYGLYSERVMLKTSDGINIFAHEVFTDNPKAVIIFLTGIHNPSVTAYFGHSKMLYDQGYASFLLDLRAHGESEGKVIGLGYKEHLDVRALVDYIKSNDKYLDVPIVIYGASMGGATAINSFGLMPEIHGLISVSAYSSWDDVFTEALINMNIPRVLAYLQKPFMKLHTTFKYGIGSARITPINQIKNVGDRPALIMHSTGDTEVQLSNYERLIKKAPSHVESWVREGDSHFVVQRDKLLTPYEDQDYSKQIINFLNKNF
ncbi:alpha/beta hydrolase [Serpentinicella alkaliphila]|nr:alpha/beta fold hydrolase [Serpentinicella alkaliphila]